MFKRILFPVDRSRDTQDAAETVIQLSQFCQGQLWLLAVQEGEPNPETTQAIDGFLAQLQEGFSSQGLSTEVLQRQGIPAFVICDVADELGVDLIVMGCRGIGLTQEGVNESVSNRVINLAPCPVLVVP